MKPRMSLEKILKNMNKRDILIKKNLMSLGSTEEDALLAIRNLKIPKAVGSSAGPFTIFTMWMANQFIVTLRIVWSISLLCYLLSLRILSSFYYYVKSITTTLSGVKSVEIPYGEGSARQGR